MTTAIAVTDKSLNEAWELFDRRRFLHGHRETMRDSFKIALSAALTPHGEEAAATPAPQNHVIWPWYTKFRLHDRVRKVKGASWQGRIVGFYATHLTPVGYAVESEREPGSVQIYPEAALEPLATAEGSAE